jgi:CopG antitoxin of type II toxin-antitoxin system
VSVRTARKKSASSPAGARGEQKSPATPVISGEAFDRKFDNGEDVSAYLDWDKATRPGRDTFKVNVDFPRDLLRRIDAEALRIGIPRQSWIKMRLADLLDRAETGAPK